MTKEMTNSFDRALDDCIDRVNRGESVDSCLVNHPEHAEELRPLLLAMARAREAGSLFPSADAKRAARLRFQAALEKRDRRSRARTILAHPLAWAAVAAAVVLLIAGYALMRGAIAPPAQPTLTVAAPSPSGNFAFLVSDETNAIGDFSNLNISVSKIGLQRTGSGAVEFVPQTGIFDLTLLPGDKAQELWRGDIPEGQYKAATMYVTGVQGVLTASGQAIELKVPSNKLELNKPFEAGSDALTSFTYDLSVVRAGQAQGGLKYLLKPQVAQSGVTRQPALAHTPGIVPGQEANPGRGRVK